MYSNEYTCTKVDTKNTTKSIVADNESKRKTHSTFNKSTLNHEIGNTISVLVDNNETS